MRGQEILALNVEAREPLALLRATQLRSRHFGQLEIEVQVQFTRRRSVGRFVQTLVGVLAHRVQEAKTRAVGLERDE